MLKWIRQEHGVVQERMAQQVPSDIPDIIEMDELHTHVQKTAAGSSFNRKSKRASKSLQMLDITLILFFNRHLIASPS